MTCNKFENSERRIVVELPVHQNHVSPANRTGNGIPLTRFLRAASRLLQGTAAMTKTNPS